MKRLDPLRANRSADLARVAHHRVHQGGLRGVGVDPVDQRAIELDQVGAQLGQVLEARVPSTGVVHREACPSLSQLLHGR